MIPWIWKLRGMIFNLNLPSKTKLILAVLSVVLVLSIVTIFFTGNAANEEFRENNRIKLNRANVNCFFIIRFFFN